MGLLVQTQWQDAPDTISVSITCFYFISETIASHHVVPELPSKFGQRSSYLMHVHVLSPLKHLASRFIDIRGSSLTVPGHGFLTHVLAVHGLSMAN